MRHEFLKIDPAVDVITEENGNIRFVTPKGAFPMTDPFGLVRRVTDQCRDGASDSVLEAACNSPAEQAAVKKLVEALTDRRVLTVEETPTHDVLTDWVRHYAGVKEQPLPTLHMSGSGAILSALAAKLTAAGFAVAGPGGNAGDSDFLVDDLGANWGDCHIAACDHADMTWLRQMNLQAFEYQRPFLPVWLDRSCIHWGPMMLPGATGCLECLWHREQAASRNPHFSPPIYDDTASKSSILADMAAVMASGEILRWALGAHVETELGMAWRFDFLSSDLSGAKVMRLPRCPTCGQS